MKIYYSPSRNGFFIDGISNEIPHDATLLSPENHKKLLENQSNGLFIVPSDDGTAKASETLSVFLPGLEAKAKKNFLLEEAGRSISKIKSLGNPVPKDWSNYISILNSIDPPLNSNKIIDWPKMPKD